MIRAFQWDLARQVERLDWLLDQLPRYAAWGYQELYIHLEDAVEFPSLPEVARKDAYSYRQFTRLVKAADRVGIKVVPIVNLLGHTQYLIKVPALRDLNEQRHPDGSAREAGQICPLHPRTLEVAEKLLRDMLPFCTAGKVHVGLDESFLLGQHPLSKREIKRIGRAAHFARHVQRLNRLTKSLGLEMGMWADMLYFLPEAIPMLPAGITAYDWYYYPFERHPQVELFNYVERDLATPLRKQGIKYWGCPMNGAFRYEPLPHFHDRLTNIKTWWRRCLKTKAEGMLITSWEPNRLAMETTTLVDASAAQLWIDPTDLSHETMLSAGLKRTFKVKRPQSIANTLLDSDSYAFTGYPRWEINKSWAHASGGDGTLSHFKDSLKFFTKIKKRAVQWPPVLRISISYRYYLARRDLSVREGQIHVAKARQRIARGQSITRVLASLQRLCDQLLPVLIEGRHAAREMWALSRYRKTRGPNEHILAHDFKQLAQLQNWLDAVKRNPDHVFTANPLMGSWQCSFDVHNREPGVLRIDLAIKTGSTWQVVKSCHTIEFISTAAKSRNGPTHHYSAPLEVDPKNNGVQLRLSAHRNGIIQIAKLTITNGITEYHPAGTKPIQLGARAPVDQWADLATKSEFDFTFSIQ